MQIVIAKRIILGATTLHFFIRPGELLLQVGDSLQLLPFRVKPRPAPKQIYSLVLRRRNQPCARAFLG